MADTIENSSVRVSFGYGTIFQAASDNYPGGINFGYDEDVNAGAIYRMGKLVSSRVLDILVNDATTDGVNSIVVKYVDTDGVVREHTFDSVSEELINSIESSLGKVYYDGEYIVIDSSNNISVDSSTLYADIKAALEKAGFGSQSEINVNQSERILAIETSYVDTVVVEDASEGSDTQEVTLGLTTRNSEDVSIAESEVTFKIPTDEYYARIDSSLNAIANKIEDASAVSNGVEWLDIDALLAEAETAN